MKSLLTKSFRTGLLALMAAIVALGVGETLVKGQSEFCGTLVSCTSGMPPGSGCRRNWNSNQSVNSTVDPDGYVPAGFCGIVWYGLVPTTIPCGWWNAVEACH